jgi:hypothetical protein
MASLTHTYTDTHTDNLPATSRTRAGAPRRHFLPSAYERSQHSTSDRRGSHMPIDTDIHWEWRNPLNILPALILAVIVIDVIAMVLA